MLHLRDIAYFGQVTDFSDVYGMPMIPWVPRPSLIFEAEAIMLVSIEQCLRLPPPCPKSSVTRLLYKFKPDEPLTGEDACTTGIMDGHGQATCEQP